MENLLKSRSLELYGYFEGSLSDLDIEDLFFDNFLQENQLDYFGLSFFDDKYTLLDLNGELFDGKCNELELFAKFQLFCQKFGLRFVEVNK